MRAGPARRIVRGAYCAVCLLALWWSVQRARADAAFAGGDPAGAARILPGNTSYLAYGAPSEAALAEIARLNPRLAAPRLRLAMRAEERGEFAHAEALLLAANAVDRQYAARWAMANFYLRRGDRSAFLKWMRPALASSYGNRTGAFDLLWRVSGDAAQIQQMIPPALRDAYLLYTLEQRPEAIAGAAALVTDRDLQLDATDALIAAGRFEEAVRSWGQPPAGVAPFGGTGRGFDWRALQSVGVAHLDLEEGGHRIRLSGKQPEDVDLLLQYVGGLQVGAEYALDWQMEPAVAGLEWRIASQARSVGPLRFRATAAVMPLVLHYRRAAGTVRAEVDVDVRSVGLEAWPQ